MRPCCPARTHCNFHKTLLSALGPDNNFNRGQTKGPGGNHAPGFFRCAHCGGHCIRRCWLDRSLRAQRLKEKRPALPFVNFFRDAHCGGHHIAHYSLDSGIRTAGIETEKKQSGANRLSCIQPLPKLAPYAQGPRYISMIFYSISVPLADSFQLAAVAQGSSLSSLRFLTYSLASTTSSPARNGYVSCPNSFADVRPLHLPFCLLMFHFPDC